VIFVDWLSKAAQKYELAIQGFVFITNHQRLVATDGPCKMGKADRESWRKRALTHLNLTHLNCN
jgi:hypothetical protein